MAQYIIRRLLQMIPITLGILTLVFSLIHLIPGDPAMQIAGEGARPEDVTAVRTALGPVPRRCARVPPGASFPSYRHATAVLRQCAALPARRTAEHGS